MNDNGVSQYCPSCEALARENAELKAQLAASAEQEPVAWVYEYFVDMGYSDERLNCWPKGFSDDKPSNTKFIFRNIKPLYTSPSAAPKRSE